MMRGSGTDGLDGRVSSLSFFGQFSEDSAHQGQVTVVADEYRDGIEKMLAELLPGSEVVIVDSVRDWAKGVGIEVQASHLAAMAAVGNEDNVQRVVLLRHITSEMQNGIISAMSWRGFSAEAQSIESEDLFLEHLILHEVAHLRDSKSSEGDCDKWAFANLEGRLRCPG